MVQRQYAPRRKPPKPKSISKASDTIESFDRLRPGDQVVLWLRVSGREQNRRGNLDAYQDWLSSKSKKRGAVVVARFRRIRSGMAEELDDLEAAAEFAREHGATLLAFSTCRFIRPADYNSKTNPHAQPTPHDLERLREATKGTRLMTFVDPDAELDEVRSWQTKCGQKGKDRKGGRPQKAGYKKRRRLRKRPRVLRLRKKGYSLRDISRRLKVPVKTVHDWVR